MLTFQPDPSLVATIMDRMELELTAFVAGLEAAAEMHDADVREHCEYAAMLRAAAQCLRGKGRWTVYTGARPHARAFMVDAAAAALDDEEWALLAFYAESLRLLAGSDLAAAAS